MRKAQRQVVTKFLVFAVLFYISSVLVLWYTWTQIRPYRANGMKDANYYEVIRYDATRSVKVEVVIDPGHGGIDGGAEASDGTLEKDLNLAVSKRLADLFKLAGVKCLLTREDDVLLGDGQAGSRKRSDLNERVYIARDQPQAYFVSIHMNKFPQTKYWGLQVYYSRNSPLSAELANRIQQNVRQYLTPENIRQEKPAKNLLILDQIQTPAVIVECGFLSNTDEAERLRDPYYQNKLALLIFQSVMEQRLGQVPQT